MRKIAVLIATLTLLALPAGAEAIQVWGDNEIGDCTFAAAANWEEAALRHAPAEAEFVRDFHRAGGTDSGGLTSDGLFRWWHRHGIGGVRIRATRRRHPAPLTIAGLYVHEGEEWRIINPTPDEGSTWNITGTGGHMVTVLALGRRGPVVASWGDVLQPTWRQWRHDQPEVWSLSVIR